MASRPRTREADLRGALENSTDNPSQGIVNTTKEEKSTDNKKRDYQLDRALDLIRGIDLFSGKIVLE